MTVHGTNRTISSGRSHQPLKALFGGLHRLTYLFYYFIERAARFSPLPNFGVLLGVASLVLNGRPFQLFF
jgi:hypothetical protein